MKIKVINEEKNTLKEEFTIKEEKICEYIEGFVRKRKRNF